MSLVRAKLKALHSPDMRDFRDFRPSGPFGILVQAMIGPADADGAESFDFILCTPEWFGAELTGIKSGSHYVFVQEFSFQELFNFLDNYCASCEGDSWQVVATKLDRIGMWEFDDYRPYKAEH